VPEAMLLPAPPGVGKTHAVIDALKQTGSRCIYAAPTHELCEEVVARCQAKGIRTHYWRPGPTEEDECPHLPLVEFYRENGYIIRLGPCRTCSRQAVCTYREVFTSKANEYAQALVVTTWHLRRSDFWQINATENRPLVVLDEDACEALAAPVEITFQALSRFVAALQSVRDLCGNILVDDRKSEMDAWLIRRLMKPVRGGEAELALTDILRRVCLELMNKCAAADNGCWHEALKLHDSLHVYDRDLLRDEKLFESLLAAAYAVVLDKVELPNIFEPLRRLAREATPIHATRRGIQWPEVASVPVSRRIVMLDATAEPKVVEGVLGRAVQVPAIPRIEQQATIYQVMDHLFTRSGTRRDAGGDENFIRTFSRHVCQKHAGGKILAVTFMEQEEALQEYLESIHPNVTVRHYGALRGLDSFGSHDVGIIIGRPMPNEARLALLAVSAFGMEVLGDRRQPPSLAWRILDHTVGRSRWRSRIQQYADPRWQAVWRHVVTGELLQAVGRLRPLSNGASIYILTCEPLPPVFHMEGIYASDLFPAMCLFGRRKDFAERVKRYAQAFDELTTAGEPTTNANVCRRLGMKEPNGLKYRELAKTWLNAKQAKHPLAKSA